jgi:uncharacterized protein YcbX
MPEKNKLPKISLTDIRIYPIKSLAGIQLSQAEVQPQGLCDDRLFMLVDENGMFITQRKYPQLALLNTHSSVEGLRIDTTNFSSLTIKETDFTAKTTSVKIWQDECLGIIATEQVNQWFSHYLGFPVKLIKYNKNAPRPVDPNYSSPNDIVSFADGFPLLVITQTSLNDLNSKLETPVSMTNFRPNIVVDGCEAYAEDDWKRIQIGDVKFDAIKRCRRCVLTTVDPKTGMKSENGQPLKVLSQYRKSEGGVFYGMNLIPRSKGIIRVTDKVEII